MVIRTINDGTCRDSFSQVESSVFLTQWSIAGTLIGVEMDNPLSNIDMILQQADS